jgi:hypothetical protein
MNQENTDDQQREHHDGQPMDEPIVHLLRLICYGGSFVSPIQFKKCGKQSPARSKPSRCQSRTSIDTQPSVVALAIKAATHRQAAARPRPGRSRADRARAKVST